MYAGDVGGGLIQPGVDLSPRNKCRHSFSDVLVESSKCFASYSVSHGFSSHLGKSLEKLRRTKWLLPRVWGVGGEPSKYDVFVGVRMKATMLDGDGWAVIV